MLQYTIGLNWISGDHERYVIGNVNGNLVTLDWPYPVQQGGGIRVDYREQGAFGGEGGPMEGLVGVLVFIFKPCFVLAAYVWHSVRRLGTHPAPLRRLNSIRPHTRGQRIGNVPVL